MPTVFPTWAGFFAWMGDRYGLSIDAAARLSFRQIIGVYLHKRGKDGELQFDPPPDDRPQTPFEAYRELLFLNGIVDPKMVARLYGQHLAKTDAVAAGERQPGPIAGRPPAGDPARAAGLGPVPEV